MQMQTQLAIFAILLPLVASSCPKTYIYDSDVDLCYKVYTQEVTKSVAAAQCLADGARLAIISNTFTNQVILAQAKTMKVQVWIGMQCVGYTCGWDDTTPYAPGTTFSNFYPGYPNTIFGNCTYMTANTNGRWLNGDCEEMEIGFACTRPNTADSICNDYQRFNGMCYRTFHFNNLVTDAESFCVQEGGHLASINSQQEDDFITGLVNKSAMTKARIGLFTTAGSPFYQWTDGTPFNGNSYSNFVKIDPTQGLCVDIMGYQKGTIMGKWSNNQCVDTYDPGFVCKKAYPTVPTTRNPVTVDPRTVCPPSIYSINQKFSSPGYPYSYGPSNCTYYVVAPDGFVASAMFFTFNLGQNAQLTAYSSIFANSQSYIGTYMNSQLSGSEIWSTTTELYLVFNALTYPSVNYLNFNGQFVQSPQPTDFPKRFKRVLH